MSITIENIHNHIRYDLYDCEDDLESFAISWDYENKKVDKIMTEETNYYLNSKRQNLMWVEIIKNKIKWVKGEEIYIFIKCNCDGAFWCWFSRDRSKVGYVSMIIEKSGYVSRQCYNYYTDDKTEDIKYGLYIRVSSYYNDAICDLIRANKTAPVTPVTPVASVPPVASVSPVATTKTIIIKKKKVKLVVKDSFVRDVVNK